MGRDATACGRADPVAAAAATINWWRRALTWRKLMPMVALALLGLCGVSSSAA
eukprot:COSAG06_NODE_44789_length_360_cov_0.984674_1_plen_52_part_10